MNCISSTADIDDLVQNDAPIAIGVSGGKDSCALAFALRDHLDTVGHAGPRILIHSDLGRVEWKDSGPTCERLAKSTGMELVTVHRNAGDMLHRWQSRWEANVRRYESLSCVQLILPWSTPAMRFCTSELKTDVICGYLKKRFRDQTILSASGIRREESAARAKSPVAKRQAKLNDGWDWHPIIDWSLQDVLGICQRNNFRMHEAYETYGSSRVSCAFCIMSTGADLAAAAACEDNQDLYREMVDLEVRSTFGFQGSRWLAEVAPHLLEGNVLLAVADSKERARRRVDAESLIPRHLLYTAGWPTCIHRQKKQKCWVRSELPLLSTSESRRVSTSIPGQSLLAIRS